MGRHYVRGIDANDGEIVCALKALGMSVLDLTVVGDACPDKLVAGYHRRYRRQVNVLVEIKMPGKRLRAKQALFFVRWSGPIVEAHTVGEVLAAFGWTPAEIALYNNEPGGHDGVTP